MAAFRYHTKCPNCGSKDNLAVYDDGSYFCFSHCGYKSISEDYKESLQSSPKRKHKGEIVQTGEPIKSTKPVITDEERQKVKDNTFTTFNGFRGISDQTRNYFGVRCLQAEDDSILEVYYPVTQEGQLTGYKIREVPKNFRSIGRTGADCELFGQFRFNRGGKYLLLVEGEEDQLAAYQMLKEYNLSKGSDFETAVVSPTTGANSHKQIAGQYKFFDSFDNIVVCYDNDKAGKDALEKVIPVLPKGKVKIMQMLHKDPNEYLEKGDQKLFIRHFYEAEKPVPVGVLPSDQLYNRIIDQTATEKLPFPPFLGSLNDMFVGGIPLGHIVNIAAGTSVGKTTIVNEMIYYWIFNSPHMIGVVSMELDAGQYGEALMSRHLGKKLALLPTAADKLDYLNRHSEEVNNLLRDENGDPRFYLLDNRDGSVEEIQDTIEQLVVACGCKVIVVDVLQDVVEGLSVEDQGLFMKWAKGFIKSHGITFVFINHTRKPPAGQSTTSMPDEASVMGSSTVTKSASANIFLQRDKTSEDPIVRNSTSIMVPKNRVYGLTGPAGAVYYDNETHTLHNLDEWLTNNQ